MESRHLRMSVDGAIARIVIDRPEKRNAMTFEMWRAVPGLIDAATRDSRVKAVILAGATEKAFAAGADIGEFDDMFATPAAAGRYLDAVHGAERAIGDCLKPVVAMIQGDCIGGGIEMAVACDLRFASTQSRFGITPAKLGVCYSLSSTKRVMETVGVARARDLLFTGRLIDAAEALAIGLVDRLFEPHELEPQTLAYVATIAAGSQYSIRFVKRAVRAVLDGTDFETDALRRVRIDAYAAGDLAEGIRAYRERRKPDFKWNG